MGPTTDLYVLEKKKIGGRVGPTTDLYVLEKKKIGGRVGPTTDLYVLEKKKISWPYQKLSVHSPVIQPEASSLCGPTQKKQD